MTYLLDFDYTVADTSVCHGITNYKDKQKLIPQYRIYPQALELINEANANGTLIYIVSGNVGSTIKQTIEERKRYWILPIYADG